MRRLGVAFLVAVSAVVVAMASCKQGLGDRCQVKSDCTGDLICNAATGTCEEMTSGPDGNILPDANVDGGGAVDARVDAQIDAQVDAEINAL